MALSSGASRQMAIEKAPELHRYSTPPLNCAGTGMLCKAGNGSAFVMVVCELDRLAQRDMAVQRYAYRLGGMPPEI